MRQLKEVLSVSTVPIYMYDGVTSLPAGISRLFPNAAMVAGYVGGRYAWTESEWNLFPFANHVKITPVVANVGDVLDVEKGDASPDQTAAWIAMRKAAGYYRPTIYCSLSVIPAVRAGTGKYILGQDYDIWVAYYTNYAQQIAAPGLPAANCAATQYMSTAEYDVSAVYDPDWPHRTPPSVPPVVTAYPVPGDLTAAVNISGVTVVLSWASTDSPHYRYQVASGTPSRPGAAVVSQTITGTTSGPITLTGLGPWIWRVQSAGNSQFSAWQPIVL